MKICLCLTAHAAGAFSCRLRFRRLPPAPKAAIPMMMPTFSDAAFFAAIDAAQIFCHYMLTALVHYASSRHIYLFASDAYR